MLTYDKLKDNPKEFLATTSLSQAEFLRVLPVFANRYAAACSADKTLEGKPRQRQTGGGAKGTLKTMEDKLFFILVYEKTYSLQTLQGLLFGLSQPQANYWIHRLLPLLQQALAELHLTPERDPQAVATSALLAETPPDFLIDGTERRRQRPQDAAEQTACYSGKKKAHTDKNVLLVQTQTNKVVYLSPTVVGKTHDKKMVDNAPIAYPSGTTLGKDTGFQGYEPDGVITYQPKKKRKAKS